jgi:hypothetical protein
MALTKERSIATLEVTDNNIVIVRERVAIIEDGEEISHSFEHFQFASGDDYSQADPKVQAVCRAVFNQ